MDQILIGVEGTLCYVDDILLYARNELEMENRVETVLKRLLEHGVKINLSKSKFVSEKFRVFRLFIKIRNFLVLRPFQMRQNHLMLLNLGPFLDL